MKSILILVMALTGFTAYAGHEVGNAAHAVVCRSANGDILTAESLDVFEGKRLYGLQPILSQETGFLTKDAEAVLSRLLPFSPIRTLTYIQFVRNFEKQSLIVPVSFELVKDYDKGAFAENCNIEQVVLQIDAKQARITNWKYKINQEIWSKLTFTDRIAIVVHEILYRELIDHNARMGFSKQVDSLKVRQLVAELLANNLRSYQDEVVTSFLQTTFPYREYEGAMVTPHSTPRSEVSLPGEEAHSCSIAMADSLLVFEGQSTVLAPNNFEVCFYKSIWRSGSLARSFAVKAGQQMELTFALDHGQKGPFKLTVNSKDNLGFAGEGMALVTSSQNNMLFISALGFEEFAFSWLGKVLLVDGLIFDNQLHFNFGNYADRGISLRLIKPVKINTALLDVELLPSPFYKQEFYAVSRERELYAPRNLFVAGTIKFKNKRIKTAGSQIKFKADGTIESVCEVVGRKKCH
ncbi:MAG: hypothetical protein ACLGGX_03920 [Bdellovibrionia bacterium]